ncbi:hypothetical protein HaLaN_03859 [Haematococcus lacustris]|uniref:Uncharacterized protein n=1 Tax=Haematococcus lacustris TaxID=44745 RepID=A0A699YLT2_HAELA|nr:hypothetical protein HaLaN_03859 [Haematococcus lacustris]
MSGPRRKQRDREGQHTATPNIQEELAARRSWQPGGARSSQEQIAAKGCLVAEEEIQSDRRFNVHQRRSFHSLPQVAPGRKCSQGKQLGRAAMSSQEQLEVAAMSGSDERQR